MKIIFFAHNGQLYGANQVLYSLAKELKQKGHNVSILLPTSRGLASLLKEQNIKIKIIPSFPQFRYYRLSIKYLAYPLLILLNLITFPYILYYINREKPDIIYSNTSAENLGIWVAKLLNIKHICHIHEFMSLDHKTHFIGGDDKKRKYIDKSDGVILVSESVSEHILGKNVQEDKYITIPNGLDHSIEFPKAKNNIENLKLGVVGVFSPGKRQDLAIMYFSKIVVPKYPNATLHLFGDKEGKFKQKMVKLTSQYEIKDKVKFYGFVKDKNYIYDTIDILLVFSESEAFGLVTVEAMLRGIPVIGYNNAGTSEIITNAKTGFLFSNEQEFSTAILELSNNENYSQISETAVQYARTKYSIANFVNRIETFILEVKKK